MFGARIDAVLGEFAFLRQHLALAANTLATTDGFEINAEPLCGLQHRRAHRHLSAQAGGHEQDSGFFFYFDRIGI